MDTDRTTGLTMPSWEEHMRAIDELLWRWAEWRARGGYGARRSSTSVFGEMVAALNAKCWMCAPHGRPGWLPVMTEQGKAWHCCTICAGRGTQVKPPSSAGTRTQVLPHLIPGTNPQPVPDQHMELVDRAVTELPPNQHRVVMEHYCQTGHGYRCLHWTPQQHAAWLRLTYMDYLAWLRQAHARLAAELLSA